MAPKGRKPSRKGNDEQSAAAAADPRFKAIATDPRFRLPSAKHSRVNVDDRFARMFKDAEFSAKASVDRYGRKLGKQTGKKDLERFYRVEGEDKKVVGSGDEEEDDDDEDVEVDDDDAVQAELDRVERKGAAAVPAARDYAREGGFSDSSSDEDSEGQELDSDDDSEDDADVVQFPDEEEAPEVPMGEVTNRLAIVNLDWDNIRASDLFAVALSFAPGGKGVQKVIVYPSEFGRERLEREELEGPPRDIFASSSRQVDDDVASDSEEEEERIKKQLLQEDKGEEFDSGRLRQYQLDRLKYYYAVVTCDSTTTAKTLYDDMDGREYLTTANFFDLRFIPDEVTFDTDSPRDECTKLPSNYKPNEFVTDALTHSKVRLTWDADDTTRKEVQKRAFSRAEIDENDLQAYIGSDSDSDDNEALDSDPKLTKAEQQRAKMRAALGLGGSTSSSSKSKKNDAPVGEMQVTFTSGLTNAAEKDPDAPTSVFENDPAHVNETTRETYVRKEKERKQRRKDKAKAVRAGLSPEEAAAAAQASDDEREAEKREAVDGDLGFDDPFFVDAPGAAQKAEKEARKAAKAKKRAERELEDKAVAAQRAELELLMVDDKADNAMRHFDMKEIAKAEKLARKKKGGKKTKGKDLGVVEGADFEVETADPRFQSLYQSHEFAIDPTNPKFVGTKGMKALLEEGRKKRKGGAGDDGEDGEVDAGSRKEKRAKKEDARGAEEENDDGEDLQKLLARVKSKTKKR